MTQNDSFRIKIFNIYVTLVKDASVRNYQHQQSKVTLEIAYKVAVHLKLSEIIRAVGYKCHLKIVCLLLKYSKK